MLGQCRSIRANVEPIKLEAQPFLAEPIGEHPLIFARLPAYRYPASSIARRRKRIASAGLTAQADSRADRSARGRRERAWLRSVGTFPRRDPARSPKTSRVHRRGHSSSENARRMSSGDQLRIRIYGRFAWRDGALFTAHERMHVTRGCARVFDPRSLFPQLPEKPAAADHSAWRPLSLCTVFCRQSTSTGKAAG